MRRGSVCVKSLIAIAVAVVSFSAAWAQDGHPEKPCSSPEYSQFDFWVGDWQVTSPDGKQQGTNNVVKMLGGCVIQENWVDSNGSLLLLDGGIEDGRMVLRGETPARDGKGIVMHEISWTSMDTGKVRQHW